MTTDSNQAALDENNFLVMEPANLAAQAMRLREERYQCRLEQERKKRFAIDWIGSKFRNTKIVCASSAHAAAAIAAGVDCRFISPAKWQSDPTYAGEYLINCYEVEDGSGRRMILTREA